MITVDKPGSPSEILEHFGKKGMKWGVRNEAVRSAGSTAKKASDPNRAAAEAFRQKNPTAKTKANAIHTARSNVEKQKKAFEKEKDPGKREKLRKEYLNNPERATALRTTRGEKVVMGVLMGTFGVPTGILGVGLAGYTGHRIAKRQKIERKLATGGYK